MQAGKPSCAYHTQMKRLVSPQPVSKRISATQRLLHFQVGQGQSLSTIEQQDRRCLAGPVAGQVWNCCSEATRTVRPPPSGRQSAKDSASQVTVKPCRVYLLVTYRCQKTPQAAKATSARRRKLGRLLSGIELDQRAILASFDRSREEPE